LPKLRQQEVYGDGLLARIPQEIADAPGGAPHHSSPSPSLSHSAAGGALFSEP
jgi:hypothetical protein